MPGKLEHFSKYELEWPIFRSSTVYITSIYLYMHGFTKWKNMKRYAGDNRDI